MPSWPLSWLAVRTVNSLFWFICEFLLPPCPVLTTEIELKLSYTLARLGR